MAKFCVMSNDADINEVRVYYPNSNYERAYAISKGYFHSSCPKWNNGKIFSDGLFNTKKEAKEFQKNCGLEFPEYIVKEIDDTDPRIY